MWMPTANAAVFSSNIKSTDARENFVLLAERRSAGSWWDSAGRTIVQSASEAENLIGHQGRRLHLENIVDADYVGATQDRCSHCGSGRTLQEAVGRLLQLRQE